MKRRDRAIVGVILAAALIGGLVLVSRALSQAAQAQADSLAAAQFNGGTGAASSPSVQTDGPQVGAGASSGDLSEPEHSGGEVGTDQPEQGEGNASSDGSGTESTQPGGSGESGSAAETPAAPSAGGGAKTLDELSRWMQNESSGALAAQSQLQAEQALAGGITLDAVSVALDSAVSALLELTGERVTDAVVDQVFSKFCVGK